MNSPNQDINSHTVSHNAAVKVAAQVGQLPLRQYLVQAAAIATVVGLASYVAVDQLAPAKHRQWMKPAALLAIPALPATVAGVVSWVEWSYRRRQRELQHAAAIGVSLSSPTTRSQHEPLRSPTQQPGASPEISGYGPVSYAQANQQSPASAPARKSSLFDPPAGASQPKIRRIEEAIEFNSDLGGTSSDDTGATTSVIASTAPESSESGNRSGGRGNVVSLFSSPASSSSSATAPASPGGSAVSKATQPRGIDSPINSPVNSLFSPAPARTGAKAPIDITVPAATSTAGPAPAQSATSVAVAPGTDRTGSQGGSTEAAPIYSDPFGGSAWDEDAVG